MSYTAQTRAPVSGIGGVKSLEYIRLPITIVPKWMGAPALVARELDLVRNSQGSK